MNRNFILEQSRRDNTREAQITPHKRSVVWGILTLILLLATLTVAAQNNYSPCYTNNMAKGDAAFKQGRYSEAKTYYVNAKKCNGGNPTAAQQKINSCDAKIKVQKEAAEAKRRAEKERVSIITEGVAEEDIFSEEEISSEESAEDEFIEVEIQEDNLDPVRIYTEEMPEFPGGEKAMQAFIDQEVKYPDVARKNGITGTVLVEFVVEKDGSISNAKTKVPLFPECDKEAIRCVMAMPKWKPGKDMGKPVRCSYQVPVTFRL